MVYILCGVILILLAIILLQRKASKETGENLRYASRKLDKIIAQNSSERLLIVTDREELRELLAQVNRLLNYNHEVKAEGNRLTLSMNRMLSNFSHDLKTPLTVVLGYIEMMRQDAHLSPEERDAMLSTVHTKATEVLGLVNQFFNLARLEADDWILESTTVHINEVCRQAMLGHYDILTAKGFDVVVEIPEPPVYAEADESALYRVLNNLLSNAIRHGGDGKVIGLIMRYDKAFVLIDVWDRGRGLQEADQERIFQRLYSREDPRALPEGGSGLGLTISRRLVEKMGGLIRWSSIPYEETVFTVSLKRVRP